MKSPWCALMIVPLLAAGCAAKASPPTAAAQAAPSAPTAFTGEVWTWDEQTSTVTLRQGTQTVRVKVTPDQLAGLRLHETARVQGQLAPPADVVTMTGPAALVAQGPVDEQQVQGKVTAIDPAGTMHIDTSRGPVTVWTPERGTSAFKPGDDVKVTMRVQALQPAAAPAGQPATEPAASAPSEPGEYAVVRGPITASSPGGQITVQSPRGPVQVWVPDANRYRTGQYAEVRTVVQAAR
jgi:hypothetical protein